MERDHARGVYMWGGAILSGQVQIAGQVLQRVLQGVLPFRFYFQHDMSSVGSWLEKKPGFRSEGQNRVSQDNN
jgi:hypothetical protein